MIINRNRGRPRNRWMDRVIRQGPRKLNVTDWDWRILDRDYWWSVIDNMLIEFWWRWRVCKTWKIYWVYLVSDLNACDGIIVSLLEISSLLTYYLYRILVYISVILLILRIKTKFIKNKIIIYTLHHV